MLDLPLPAGFAIERDAFDAAVKAGRAAKYELTPRSVIVYLRRLEPNERWTLQYRLRPTLPVRSSAGAPVVYEYYNPSRRSTGSAERFVVKSDPSLP
jgi:hypothetical protein